jgi:hypothetical protein
VLLAAGAGLATAALVLLLGTGLGWWAAAPAPTQPGRLDVRTSLVPSALFFGDPLTAEVDVAVGSSATGIQVVPTFGPFAVSGRPLVSRSRDGRLETVRYRYAIQCVSDGCLPLGKPRVLRLPPVVVSARANGRASTVRVAWPAVSVASRLSSAAGARDSLRRPSNIPPATFGISPRTLANVLTAAAGVLALLAFAVIGRELVRLERRRRTVRLTPLEAALLYTRQSAARRDAADRRKALALLAQTLDAEGDSVLADAAAGAAWSDAAPTAQNALELADEVETAASDGR